MGKYTKRSPKFFENIRAVDGIKERRCSNCQEWFPETTEYFYMINKKKPEKGFQAECKKCAVKRTMKYQKVNIEKTKIYRSKYNKSKKGKIRKIRCEKIRGENGKNLEWQRNNKDKMLEYRTKRQHKKHNINKIEWNNCKEYFNNSCAYCDLHHKEHLVKRNGKIINMDLHKEHVDHEGKNDLSNCVPSCQSCNSKKRKLSIEEWYNDENENYTQERYDRIQKWLQEDYKQYIVIDKKEKVYNK